MADDRNGRHEDEEVELPGLEVLRAAVANRLRRLPRPGRLRQDGIAGLTVAISSVPDGMASGLLAGVNPIYGLYASMIGPLVGGLLASTVLMVISNTSATALVAGQALVGVSGENRDRALFLLVILSGAIQILFGLLRFGRLTRFVSFSVMTRTPIRAFASLVAIAVPTLAVALLGWDDVQLVADVGDIPRGLPTPFIPALSDFSIDVLTGALSLAFVVLVQGAGVGQSVPNPDGSRSSNSRNFIAQGAANVAAGLLRGVPVGGSLGATARSTSPPARGGAGRRSPRGCGCSSS